MQNGKKKPPSFLRGGGIETGRVARGLAVI